MLHTCMPGEDGRRQSWRCLPQRCRAPPVMSPANSLVQGRRPHSPAMPVGHALYWERTSIRKAWTIVTQAKCAWASGKTV